MFYLEILHRNRKYTGLNGINIGLDPDLFILAAIPQDLSLLLLTPVQSYLCYTFQHPISHTVNYTYAIQKLKH